MPKNRDPYLDDGMRGFIHNFARKNMWRAADWYDLDDLIQDGWMCYYKVRNNPAYAELTSKIDPTSDDRRHMMALVVSTFMRHASAVASWRTKTPESERTVSSLCCVDENVEDVWNRIAPRIDGEASVAALLATMPRELLDVVDLMIADSVEFKRRRVRKDGDRVRRVRRGLRETTNEMMCRLLGADPTKRNIRGEIELHLTS